MNGITILIPACNERDGIGVTVERVKAIAKSLGPGPVEILVVDDGSNDGTGDIAERAGARTVRHPHNIGYGAALKTGIRSASFDTIVTTDADGSYPADAMPALVALYRQGFDMAVGARSGRVYRGSALKWPMRLILRFLVEWTAGRQIPDINSGLRVFSRETMLRYLPALSSSFSFTTSATLVYMLAGRFVAYQPIGYAERIGTSHVRLWRDSLRTLQYIVRTIVLFNPIKLFLLLALICFVGGFIGGLVLWLLDRLDLGILVAALASVSAVIVFALGLVTEALQHRNMRSDVQPEAEDREAPGLRPTSQTQPPIPAETSKVDA